MNSYSTSTQQNTSNPHSNNDQQWQFPQPPPPPYSVVNQCGPDNKQRRQLAASDGQQCNAPPFPKECDLADYHSPPPPYAEVVNLMPPPPTQNNALPVRLIAVPVQQEPICCCCDMRTAVICAAVWKILTSISVISFLMFIIAGNVDVRISPSRQQMFMFATLFQGLVLFAFLIVLQGAIKRRADLLKVGILLNILIYIISSAAFIFYCIMIGPYFRITFAVVLEFYIFYSLCKYQNYLENKNSTGSERTSVGCEN